MRRQVVQFLVLYLSCASGLVAQAAFQNLDFEDANVSDLPPNQFEFVSVIDGLPSWSAYIGTNQLAQVGHNWITLGDANVGILGPQYPFDTQPLEGSYTAILQPGDFSGQMLPASVAQTGLIPAWANSLQFKAWMFYTNDLSVSVGGQDRPVVGLGSGSFGCDVSAFAGSVEELRFTIATTHGNDLNWLEAITFSPDAIPEPSALSLLAIAAVGLGLWHLTYRRAA